MTSTLGKILELQELTTEVSENKLKEGIWFAFTVNPKKQYQFKDHDSDRVKAIQTDMLRILRTLMFRADVVLFGEISMPMEVNVTHFPRFHFHGLIKIRHLYGYLMDISKVSKDAHFCVRGLKDMKWIDYCLKNYHFMRNNAKGLYFKTPNAFSKMDELSPPWCFQKMLKQLGTDHQALKSQRSYPQDMDSDSDNVDI